MGYAVGVKAFWVVLEELIGVGGAWIFMARRFKRLTDKYDSITVPDHLESRFRENGHSLRLIAASALVGFAVVMLYTTQGGFTAVVWSDVFQGSLMVAGLVLLPLLEANGFSTWNQYLTDLDVLLPSFLVCFVVAVLVSLFDKAGQARVAGVEVELAEAAR